MAPGTTMAGVRRRDALKLGILAMLTTEGIAATTLAARTHSGGKPDYTLRIGRGDVEVAPGKIITSARS